MTVEFHEVVHELEDRARQFFCHRCQHILLPTYTKCKRYNCNEFFYVEVKSYANEVMERLMQDKMMVVRLLELVDGHLTVSVFREDLVSLYVETYAQGVHMARNMARSLFNVQSL